MKGFFGVKRAQKIAEVQLLKQETVASMQKQARTMPRRLPTKQSEMGGHEKRRLVSRLFCINYTYTIN